MKFKKILTKMAVLGTIASPAISTIACGTEAEALDPAKKDSVIQIVGPNGHKDKGFNQGAYDGAQDAIKTIPGLKSWRESKAKNSETSSAKEGVNKALQAGAYIILGTGYQYPQFINGKDYAGKYPNREFIGIDGAVQGDVKKNVIAISFKAQQSSFLAGVATGLFLAKNYETYKTDGGLKVGAFGGGAFPPIKDMLTGFMMGLAYYNDKLAKDRDHKVKFIGWNGEENGFTGGFTASAKSIATAKGLIAKKADVVFPVAGGQVTSMVDAIKTSNAKTKIVGVDSDQEVAFGQDGNHFITSSLKSTRVAALEALKAIYQVQGARIKKGQNNLVGLEGGFIGIAKGDFDSDDYKGSALAGIIKGNGGIDTTADKTVYNQLIESTNSIYQYAISNDLNDWEKAKVVFGYNGDKVLVLSDFSA